MKNNEKKCVRMYDVIEYIKTDLNAFNSSTFFT